MSDAVGVEAQLPEDSSPGARLKHERERRALSVQQAAEELHLDTWVVEAIEADRFQALGAPVYARGHLRKYATRLGLPIEDIIERYERLQDRPVETDPIPAALVDPIRPPRRSLKGPLWIIFALVAIAILGWGVLKYLNMELPDGSFEPRPPNGTASEAFVAPASTQIEQSTPPAAEPSRAAATSVSEQTAGPQAATAASPDEAPAVQAATVNEEVSEEAALASEPIEIRLEFSGESWTEVYDASGTRLMYAMGSPGRVRTLSGTPPIQVTLGSVSAVRMQVNGESVAIPRRDGRESTRFAINADGNLR
jgi:cytoskeleton protein RodZ